jgi:integrase
MNLLECLERWDRVAHRSSRTVQNYRWALDRLARAGIACATDVSHATLARYLESRSARNAPQELAALSSMVGYLVACGEAPRELTYVMRDLRPPAKKRRPLHARFLSRDEYERLRSAARRQRMHGAESELVVVLGTLSGLRAGELARLHWDAIDLKRRLIHVRFDESLGERGGIKTHGERLVPICAELLEFLRARSKREGYVFPHGVGASKNAVATVATLHWRVVRARIRAGIPDAKLVVLRHTRASWWVQAGVPIAKVSFWLGHSPEICSRFYAGLLQGYDPDCERAA